MYCQFFAFCDTFNLEGAKIHICPRKFQQHSPKW